MRLSYNETLTLRDITSHSHISSLLTLTTHRISSLCSYAPSHITLSSSHSPIHIISLPHRCSLFTSSQHIDAPSPLYLSTQTYLSLTHIFTHLLLSHIIHHRSGETLSSVYTHLLSLHTNTTILIPPSLSIHNLSYTHTLIDSIMIYS